MKTSLGIVYSLKYFISSAFDFENTVKGDEYEGKIRGNQKKST